MTIQLEKLAKLRCSWALIGACTVAVTMLGACQDPEIVLPGKREDIRSVLQSTEAAAEVIAQSGNVSRAISLPNLAANTEWAQGIGTEDYRVSNAALAGTLQLAWSTKIGGGDSRKQRITADPVVAGGLIYTLDASTNVTATSTSGAQVWTTDVRPERDGAGDATGGGVAVHNGSVYVSTGFGELVSLDAKTGGVRGTQ